jgi:hypothetical protein
MADSLKKPGLVSHKFVDEVRGMTHPSATKTVDR